jgi:hypothetical protein
MRHRVSITVPSKANGRRIRKALRAEYREKAVLLLATLFGGFTALEGEGGFIGKGFRLEREPVTVVFAFYDAAKRSEVAKVKALAREMCEALSQESVAVEVDGEMLFIAAEAA